MPTFHVVHHETDKPAQLFEVGYKKPLRYKIVGQSIRRPAEATTARYQMNVSDHNFFAGLIKMARKSGSAPLTLKYDDGNNVQLKVNEVEGKLFLENHHHSFAILTGQNGTDGEVQAMAMDPISGLTLVAVVAIIAIAAIAITDNGGSLSGEASSGDQSAGFEAEGGQEGGGDSEED